MTASIEQLAAHSDESLARRVGLKFVDGSIPGYALLLGQPDNLPTDLLADLTRRGILVFVAAETLAAKIAQNGQTLGWDAGVVALDPPNAFGLIAKIAQIFGDAAAPAEIFAYARQRLRGFALTLDPAAALSPDEAALADHLNCPVLAFSEDSIQLGIEASGMQIKVPLPELPVAYSPDFSGQAVRDDLCGACLTGVELVVTGESLVDGRITLNGPDLDAAAQGDQPYALLIEVSGSNFQPDFEPVLERQIETILNDTEGLIHRGQRTIVTLRAHQNAIQNGLRFQHLGQILYARLHNDFGNILNRVQITFTTDPAQVDLIRQQAQAIYQQRDERLQNLTDESVETFYTCNLCQTIAAGHLCVISPEHPGVCGAVDWMDARAAVQIQPVGHNQIIPKEGLIDAQLGQWARVNQVVAQESGGTMTAYSLYSLMQDPGSACGDFECITAMLPLANGVMVVGRNFDGLTPSGMDWPMLHEMVAAGMPVPGFLGHSKRALHRDKFIAAEGGWRRIVWMDAALREELAPILESLAAAAGISGFVEMIATEAQAQTEDEILAHMEAVGHPALQLAPMF